MSGGAVTTASGGIGRSAAEIAHRRKGAQFPRGLRYMGAKITLLLFGMTRWLTRG
jgi:hypothetical protein